MWSLRASLIIVFFLVHMASAQSHRHVPRPLSIPAPFETAWDTMLQTLADNGYEIERKDRSKGSIRTKLKEYISGPLAEAHIRKIADRSKLMDGEWARAEYEYLIDIQFVSERETTVSVDARIRGLKRPFIGGEEWVKLQSRGKLEEDLLTLFGKHLYGASFKLDAAKPGFWERQPGHVRDIEEPPRVIGPERPPH